MVLLPFSQSTTSAIVEAVLSVSASFALTMLSTGSLRCKMRSVSRGKVRAITPNDFTHGLGHVGVLIFERYISLRGCAVTVVAIALTVTGSTGLLGTGTERCVSSGVGYAELTDISDTLCYKRSNAPGSVDFLSRAGGQVHRLMYTDIGINVDVHPKHFDLEKDEVTQFSELDIDVAGRVTNAEECTARVIYTEVNSQFSISTSEDGINSLESNETITARPSVYRDANWIGMTNDLGKEELVAVYAKEVTIGERTIVYLVYGYAANGHQGEIEDSKCVKMEYTEPGLQVLTFGRAIFSLGKRSADPIRLAKLAWLTATLSHAVARTQACRRRNYRTKSCSSLSLNTMITVSVVMALASITAAWVACLICATQHSPLSKIANPYQMFASAVGTNGGQNESASVQSNYTYVAMTAEAEQYRIVWFKA